MVDPLQIRLGERGYPITFSDELAPPLREQVAGFVASGRAVAVLTDRNVARAQGALLDGAFGGLSRFEVEPGEGSKSLGVLEQVLEFLAQGRLDRGGVLFAVGGGVVGDLGGFAAASYLRGIDYVQVPTTLLAMVDSSVGGKTGVNLKAGKNLVGAFHQPRAVHIGVRLLDTLPPREFAAGMAEVIKYGLLGDQGLFEQLERGPLKRESRELAAVIRRCCALKAAVVEADERETAAQGGRALLNLGHTFGHAIEQVTGYGAYLHGEAVAVGLAAAARLSAKLGHLPAADVGRIERTISAHGLPIRLKEPLPLAALVAAAGRDKKVRGGVPRFVVLHGVGQAAVEQVPPALAAEAFREIGASA